MPNHIVTVIQAPAEVLDSIRVFKTAQEQYEEYVENRNSWSPERTLADFDSKYFADFDKVIPSPPNKEVGGCSSSTHEEGVICWYTWNIENWGTKWNAYEYVDGGDTRIQFQTAWSHPFKVIEALSKKFPSALLSIEYADEDLGSNVGKYTMMDGTVIVDMTPEEGSCSALDLACDLHFDCSYEEFREQY